MTTSTTVLQRNEETRPADLAQRVANLEAERDELRARLAGNAIPDGWKLVPFEPTADMITAGRRRMSEIGIYRNMIAAAPEHKA